jgi:hypothetical protein
MTKILLTPEWMDGFVDRSASFFAHVEQKDGTRLGQRLRPEFRIVQPKSERALIVAIRSFFGCGNIRQNKSDQYEYRVRELPDLKIIIDFFLAKPLKSSKQREVIIMKHVLDVMLQKRQLSKSEFNALVLLAKPLMRPAKRGVRN